MQAKSKPSMTSMESQGNEYETCALSNTGPLPLWQESVPNDLTHESYILNILLLVDPMKVLWQ